MCTCLWIVSRGLICRHFFRVLRISDKAVFSISLIASRWYKEVNDFIDIEHEAIENDMTFQHLNVIRSNHKIHPDNKHQVLKRKKYGKLYGLSKRAMQISIDCDDNEVEEFLENYITQKEHELDHNKGIESEIDKENESLSEQETSNKINNPVVNKHTKGRPTKRARFKNVVETFKDKSNVKVRMCQNCKEGGHNSRTCIKPCGNCGNLSHKIHQCKN